MIFLQLKSIKIVHCEIRNEYLRMALVLGEEKSCSLGESTFLYSSSTLKLMSILKVFK